MPSNIKIIDIFNFHSEIEGFCSENSIDVCDNDILIKMIQKGYFFSSIAPSKIKLGLAELRFSATNGKHEDSLSIINGFNLDSCPYCRDKLEKEEKEEEDYKMDSD